jgi:hypothetical protein
VKAQLAAVEDYETSKDEAERQAKIISEWSGLDE